MEIIVVDEVQPLMAAKYTAAVSYTHLQVRGFDGTADNAVVKEHIRRIRNKLGAQYIETVWGCGYKWVK